jgi:DUF4097 and DUF4098 domain-containing protein YvlB
MKFNSSIITILLAALLLCGASAHAQQAKGKGEGQGQGQGKGQGTGQGEDEGKQQGSEVLVATTDTVNVSLTTGAGRISVRGWERNEVRAQAVQAGAKIETHKAETQGDAAAPALRLEIIILEESEEGEPEDNSCNSATDVVLNVPRGATVYLKTQEGDVDVDGVAEAHIETTEGRIEARRIQKVTDATSIGGNVALEDASGRARLSSLGGVVEVRNLRPSDVNDFVKVRTASGDILLDRIGPARVEASTISGELRMMGPLARGGVYDFTTTNGDVTIFAPADSSFSLNAKISEGGEISTDFQLKYKGSVSPFNLLHAGRLQGTYGTGNASITLVSFSGTLRLKKQ